MSIKVANRPSPANLRVPDRPAPPPPDEGDVFPPFHRAVRERPEGVDEVLWSFGLAFLRACRLVERLNAKAERLTGRRLERFVDDVLSVASDGMKLSEERLRRRLVALDLAGLSILGTTILSPQGCFGGDFSNGDLAPESLTVARSDRIAGIPPAPATSSRKGVA